MASIQTHIEALSRACMHWLALLVYLLWSMTAMANTASGFYGVTVNGVMQTNFALLLLDDELHPYMANEDFLALGFSKSVIPQRRGDLAWVPLYGNEGMVFSINAKNHRVSLELGPHWFATHRIQLNPVQSGQPLPAPFGALLNYSLQASRSANSILDLNGTQSLSLFGSAGFFQLTTAMKSVDSSSGASRHWADKTIIRLGTTFWRDDPETLTTLSLGDDVMQAGSGVPGIRYGGISWQSNFGLNPAFSTLESPTLFDSARLPSTLEFFLNDRRIGAPLAVASGPFEISGLPTIGVNGTLNVLIRDALNNERIVALPYLRTASLYRQGVHGFSYTAGLLRQDLDQYETPFLASSHRWGVTRRLTLDAGMAFSARQSSTGAGATMSLFGNVIGNGHFAVSRAPSGAGQQLGASVQWQDSRASMGASISHSSPAFELLGDSGLVAIRPRDEMRLFAARSLGHSFGSVSLSLGRLSDWSGTTRSVSSAGWSRSFGVANVSLSAVHTTVNHLLQFIVSLPLERKAFLSTSLQKQAQGVSVRTDYATAPVMGKGVAWRLGLADNDPPLTTERTRVFGGLDMRSDFGEHGGDWVASSTGVSWRIHTAGSLGVLAGHRFFGPPIAGGFALVATGDAPDIPIYRWNLPVAVSDSRGLALVTTLSPYQKNLLAIKPEEVPFQYRIDKHEITAVPRGRGGVLVDFSMLHERPAVIVLTSPDGQVTPAGAKVRVLSSGETSFIGLRGEVYLRNLPVQTDLEVSFKEKKCHVFLNAPATADPQPRIGPFVCALRKMP